MDIDIIKNLTENQKVYVFHQATTGFMCPSSLYKIYHAHCKDILGLLHKIHRHSYDRSIPFEDYYNNSDYKKYIEKASSIEHKYVIHTSAKQSNSIISIEHKLDLNINGFTLNPDSKDYLDKLQKPGYSSIILRSDLRYRSIYISGFFCKNEDGSINISDVKIKYKSQYVKEASKFTNDKYINFSLKIVDINVIIKNLASNLNSFNIKPIKKSNISHLKINCDADRYSIEDGKCVENSIFYNSAYVDSIVSIIKGTNKLTCDITNGEPYFLISIKVRGNSDHRYKSYSQIITKDGESFYPVFNKSSIARGSTFQHIKQASIADGEFLKFVMNEYRKSLIV